MVCSLISNQGVNFNCLPFRVIFCNRKMCSSAGCSKFFCVIFSLAGLILSVYSLHVKTQVFC